MIFLNIVLDDSINSTEKTQMILEVLGNNKYRPSTAKYIRMNVSKLIDICGNEASRDEEQPNKLRYNIQKCVRQNIAIQLSTCSGIYLETYM